jgi:hypothetical protein
VCGNGTTKLFQERFEQKKPEQNPPRNQLCSMRGPKKRAQNPKLNQELRTVIWLSQLSKLALSGFQSCVLNFFNVEKGSVIGGM